MTPTNATADLERRLEFAVDIARRAGADTLRWFRRGVDVERKADGSPVTEADRSAERLLRRAIATAYPDDAVLGEELGETAGASDGRWILDPIDGTAAFVSGVPLYGVLVAWERAGAPTLGVLHFPALGETVAAARGLGCRFEGRAAAVSTVDRLEDARVLTTDLARAPYSALEGEAARAYERAQNQWDSLRDRARLARTWGDAFGYALVATGRAECMMDPHVSIWDAAPLLPVVEEAGGVFTDLGGRRTHAGGSALATNAALAATLRRHFQTEVSP